MFDTDLHPQVLGLPTPLMVTDVRLEVEKPRSTSISSTQKAASVTARNIAVSWRVTPRRSFYQ